MSDGNGGQTRFQQAMMWVVAIPVLLFLLIAVVPTLLSAPPGH